MSEEFDVILDTREYNRNTTLDNAKPIAGKTCQVKVTLYARTLAMKLARTLRDFDSIEFVYTEDGEKLAKDYPVLRKYFPEFTHRKYKNKLTFKKEQEENEEEVEIGTNDSEDEGADE